MIEPEAYPQEEQRLQSLRNLKMLDAPIEERFERITRMVCRILDVPIALFNLIDEDRQHYKSVQGLPNTDASKEAAFCTHVLHEQHILLVPDTSKDERFYDNPFVTGKFLNIGFYAGVPVRTPDGMPIGTLCAIDTKPREISEAQVNVMRDLAAMVETELKFSFMSKAQESLIDELKEANHMALVDPLTRIWNRTGIMRLLDREWSTALRQGNPVSVVMCDIDHFKNVNDAYGHPAGDAVLKGVAKTILKTLRTEDSVGRVGGEEFLIMLTDCKPESLFETVERIRAAVEVEAFVHEGQEYKVTMSFGAVSVIPDEAINPEKLIKRADELLYRAKNGGRNRVECQGEGMPPL